MELLREIPAAEAIEGNPGRTGADMYRISALITTRSAPARAKTADALRPLYLDYLEKHGDDIRRPLLRHPARPGCCRHAARSARAELGHRQALISRAGSKR